METINGYAVKVEGGCFVHIIPPNGGKSVPPKEIWDAVHLVALTYHLELVPRQPWQNGTQIAVFTAVSPEGAQWAAGSFLRALAYYA